MTTPVKTRIIKIGNSQGIRIPKMLLLQAGLHDEVEVDVQSGQLVIRPLRVPREGWDEAFAEMTAHGDDALLDEESFALTEWEAREWHW
jgi:antitoxin MazE